MYNTLLFVLCTEPPLGVCSTSGWWAVGAQRGEEGDSKQLECGADGAWRRLYGTVHGGPPKAWGSCPNSLNQGQPWLCIMVQYLSPKAINAQQNSRLERMEPVKLRCFSEHLQLTNVRLAQMNKCVWTIHFCRKKHKFVYRCIPRCF